MGMLVFNIDKVVNSVMPNVKLGKKNIEDLCTQARVIKSKIPSNDIANITRIQSLISKLESIEDEYSKFDIKLSDRVEEARLIMNREKNMAIDFLIKFRANYPVGGSGLSMSAYGIDKYQISSKKVDGEKMTITLKDGTKYIFARGATGTISLVSIQTYYAGVKQSEYFYTDNKLTSAIFYSQNGKALKKANYNENGTLSSLDTFDDAGKKVETINYDIDGETAITKITYEYDENDKLKYQYEYDFVTDKTTRRWCIDGEIVDLNPFIYSDGNLSYEDIAEYFDYGNTSRLSTELTNILSPEDIEEINEKIKYAVESAGPGTGRGVAAAASTLIIELKRKGVLLPYYYGGGHNYPLTEGIDSTWGKTTYANGERTMRDKNSLDCSGFVAWAINNAGISSPSYVSGTYSNFGEKISFEQAAPGDVLCNGAHIVLVVDSYVDSKDQLHLVCAESTGSGASNASYNASSYNKVGNDTCGGVILTDYIKSDTTSYNIVSMENYYENKYKP